MPFGVNSDACFRAQKLRIRVRGCVFSHRRDSRQGGSGGNRQIGNSIGPLRKEKMRHMSIEGVRGFGQDRSVRENGAQLLGTRARPIWSH